MKKKNLYTAWYCPTSVVFLRSLLPAENYKKGDCDVIEFEYYEGFTRKVSGIEKMYIFSNHSKNFRSLRHGDMVQSSPDDYFMVKHMGWMKVTPVVIGDCRMLGFRLGEA